MASSTTSGISNRISHRSSNLELMRIVLMLLVIAHHFVVNSGVRSLWTPSTLTQNAAFLVLWGMWGKAAINAFVMVTGWFMCRSRLTWKKYARLLAQMLFWKALLWPFLAMVGAKGVSFQAVVQNLLAPFSNVDGGFTASFLAMYLSIPFLNRLLGALDRLAHLRLLALLLGIYTVSSTFLFSATAFSEYGWYCTLYLIAAYLRTYRPAWSRNRRTVSLLFAASLALSVVSVVAIMLLDKARGASFSTPYWFVNDSGKLLALTSGVTCFLWFEGLNVPASKAVNAIASTTFGVLLIHAHSDCMRRWLWRRAVNVSRLYRTCTLPELVGWSAVVAVAVFVVCSALDMMRIRLVEPHFLRWLDDPGERVAEQVRKLLLRVVSHAEV